MPRYFFHAPDGRDEEGVDLPDDAAAKATARQTFGQMIADQSVDVSSAYLHVMDESGRAVAFLNFTAWGE